MKATKETAAEVAVEENNIDTIRDILFGVQVKDFEQRFAKLESKLEDEISKHREIVEKRFAKLEEQLGKEVDSLSEKIYAEQDSRNVSIKDLSSELNKAKETLIDEIEKLRVIATSQGADLQNKLAELRDSLSKVIESKHKESQASLEKKAEELHVRKVDRDALARAFSDFAKLLSNDKTVEESE